ELGESLETRDVVQAARGGDFLARSVIEHSARMLGAGMTQVANVFNPERIVVGGGFGSAAFDLLEEPARRELQRRTPRAARAGLEVVPAKLGNDAGVVGAAKAVFDDARSARPSRTTGLAGLLSERMAEGVERERSSVEK